MTWGGGDFGSPCKNFVSWSYSTWRTAASLKTCLSSFETSSRDMLRAHWLFNDLEIPSIKSSYFSLPAWSKEYAAGPSSECENSYMAE